MRSLYFDCFTFINGPYEDALFHFKPAADRERHINPLSLHPSRSRLWVYEPVHKLVFIVFSRAITMSRRSRPCPPTSHPRRFLPSFAGSIPGCVARFVQSSSFCRMISTAPVVIVLLPVVAREPALLRLQLPPPQTHPRGPPASPSPPTAPWMLLRLLPAPTRCPSPLRPFLPTQPLSVAPRRGEPQPSSPEVPKSDILRSSAFSHS